jgi:hypothetical protein
MKIDPAEDGTEANRTSDAGGADGGSAPDPEPEPEPEPSGGTADGTDVASETDGTDVASETDGTDVADGAEPLTIGLPDGSESVSEAILSHRRMLTNPSEHGLVSADDAEDVVETLEELAAEVPDDLQEDLEALETSVEELAAGLDRQGRQIRELRETVASLAEILGTSVDFEDADGEQEES